MKTLIKTLLVLILAVGSFMLTSCEKEIGIDVTINWTDNENFTDTGDWYVAVAEGVYSVVSGLPSEPFDYEEVTPGTTTTVKFSTESTTYESYTAIVFLDKNENGAYDKDEDVLTGYDTEGADPGDNCKMTVNAYY